VDLRHVDDVGAEQSSAWVLVSSNTPIVNTASEDGRAIVADTNLITRGDDAREQIGDRTVSRLNEICASAAVRATTTGSTRTSTCPRRRGAAPASDASRDEDAAAPRRPGGYAARVD
jgi:hypothetical protein